MKILVTGGAGFIGSHVVRAYQEAGHQVAVLDDFSTGKRSNLSTDTQIFEGSIEDIAFVSKVFKEFKPDVVNHHAAQVSVVVSTREPQMDAVRNIVGTLNLLVAARDTASVKKFIYASSGGAMYGNPVTLPCTEDAVPQPISPYGLSKYTAERYVWLIAQAAHFKATVLRYSNVYGPRQDPHGEAGVCAIFTAKMMENQPVTIYGDGSHLRDYVYVGDLARANLICLDKGDDQAYNLATSQPTSTMEVYRTLKDATGYELEVTLASARPGEVQEIVLSNAKAKKELDWQPSLTFKEGIAKTVEWYRQEFSSPK